MVDESKKMYTYILLCIYFRMCLSLHDYQSKGGRYSNGLTSLETGYTNQKHTIPSQKWKRREHKDNAKENHQITKGKRKEQEEI